MKYRIKPYDMINDVWILEKKIFWIFYSSVGVGSEKEVAAKAKELNERDKMS